MRTAPRIVAPGLRTPCTTTTTTVTEMHRGRRHPAIPDQISVARGFATYGVRTPLENRDHHGHGRDCGMFAPASPGTALAMAVAMARATSVVVALGLLTTGCVIGSAT